MILLLSASAMACPPSTSAAVATELRAAHKAFEDLDDKGFQGRLDAARALLPCVDEPVPSSVAAVWHRLEGLRAFSERDLPEAERQFAAARLADPMYVFPETLIPANSPVHGHYEALSLDTMERTPLAPPKQGTLLLDGLSGGAHRHGLPVLFQHLDDDGHRLHAEVLAPGQPVPDYRVARKGFRVNVPLLVGAALAGGASLGLYAGTARHKAVLLSDLENGRITDPETLHTRAGVVNTMTVGIIGLGGLAAGLGATAVIAGNL